MSSTSLLIESLQCILDKSLWNKFCEMVFNDCRHTNDWVLLNKIILLIVCYSYLFRLSGSNYTSAFYVIEFRDDRGQVPSYIALLVGQKP